MNIGVENRYQIKYRQDINKDAKTITTKDASVIFFFHLNYCTFDKILSLNKDFEIFDLLVKKEKNTDNL